MNLIGISKKRVDTPQYVTNSIQDEDKTSNKHVSIIYEINLQRNKIITEKLAVMMKNNKIWEFRNQKQCKIGARLKNTPSTP